MDRGHGSRPLLALGLARIPAIQGDAAQSAGQDGLFETLEEQERAAGVWLRDSEGAPETLDALLQLGLRLEVVRRVVGPTAAAPPLRGAEGAFGFLGAPRSHESLRLAEESAPERAMRTLAVRGLRERLPLEIVSDIAQRASANAPSWQLALWPMDPPLRSGSAIASSDARSQARRAAARSPEAP